VYKGYLAAVGVVLAVVAATASTAFGGPKAGGVVVLAKDNGVSIKPNKYMQDNMFFSPGTVTVKSGQTLTFRFANANSMEPHTLTIVRKSDLPRTGMQAENCSACLRYAAGHLKNPKAEPGNNNPIVHWILNKGKPGLDTVGDSIAIQEPGPHKSITVKVTAPAGTTLYFLCAVHPWMQGKIVVT
jgi:plastocyanin